MEKLDRSLWPEWKGILARPRGPSQMPGMTSFPHLVNPQQDRGGGQEEKEEGDQKRARKVSRVSCVFSPAIKSIPVAVGVLSRGITQSRAVRRR